MTLSAAAAFIGGILGGPRGLGVGGTVGSLLAAIYGYNKYKSLVKVINENMNDDQKRKLAETLYTLVTDIGISDISQLATFITDHETYLTKVVNILRSFLLTEMNMQLQ